LPADPPPLQEAAQPAGGVLEVFRVALGLGLTSFGGPIAHLGYFERAYVARLRWLTAEEYAGIVALCQLAPGPASSQVGFLIGLRRAGWAGAAAAWLGFTLPSAMLMFAFALAAPRLTGAWATAVLHGLKLVAVAVVAQAVWSMARKLTPDLPRLALAAAAAAVLLLAGGPLTQLVVLLAGAGAGMLLARKVEAGTAPPRLPVGPRTGLVALAVFAGLLLVSVGIGHGGAHGLAPMAAVFYRAGALVFGGGHVLLPLLRDALVPGGWLTDAQFLAGYGAAQALPGPLFTFAGYLGAVVLPPPAGLAGQLVWAATAVVFVFLPGMLVAVAGVPLWNWLGRHPVARRALAGVNAAVVGILAAALYDPIWTTSITGPADVGIALAGLLLLERWRIAPVLVVALTVVAALGVTLILPGR
jgi:chromate transporter